MIYLGSSLLARGLLLSLNYLTCSPINGRRLGRIATASTGIRVTIFVHITCMVYSMASNTILSILNIYIGEIVFGRKRQCLLECE